MIVAYLGIDYGIRGQREGRGDGGEHFWNVFKRKESELRGCLSLCLIDSSSEP